MGVVAQANAAAGLAGRSFLYVACTAAFVCPVQSTYTAPKYNAKTFSPRTSAQSCDAS